MQSGEAWELISIMFWPGKVKPEEVKCYMKKRKPLSHANAN